MNGNFALVLCGFLEVCSKEVKEIAQRLTVDEIFRLGSEMSSPANFAGHKPTAFSSLRALLAQVRSPWICFWDGAAPLSHGEFRWLQRDVAKVQANNVDIIIDFDTSGSDSSLSYVSMQQLEYIPSQAGCWIIKTDTFRRLLDQFGEECFGVLTQQALLRVFLLFCKDRLVAVRGEARRSLAPEPHFDYWRNLDTYGALLIESCLKPLLLAKQFFGSTPLWLQRAVVDQLRWYFEVDLRERAPTVIINRRRAPTFHDLLSKILAFAEENVIFELQNSGVRREVVHALLSYIVQPMHDAVQIDAYDAAQGLVRVRYFIHGPKLPEIFSVDGRFISPAYAKYRACRFFDRTLYWQRVVWLSMAPGEKLACFIDGMAVRVGLVCGHGALYAECNKDDLGEPQAIEKLNRPTKSGRQKIPFSLRAIKAWALRALASMPWVRSRFRDAWVFIDRDDGADDSAELFYAWVKAHHPEINCWFLVDQDTLDWKRLKKNAFRLLPPGVERKLLLLNAKFILSSHAQYMNGGFDPVLYGDRMRWRYVFLQHGVMMNDLSHWLGELGFDIFVTSSPAEYRSITNDDTPYQFTGREVYRTGLPRHDRLLRMKAEVAPQDLNVILVMPTWRGGLVDRRAKNARDLFQEFADSEYAKVWGNFLRAPEVHELCSRFGKQLIFVPHANVAPYVEALRIPECVQIAVPQTTSLPWLFARSAALITDYTSVAFEFAFLRRMVFYYQFDRENFFGGGHNWREGYFDFDRDGFGPVAYDEKKLLEALASFLENACVPDAEYLERMMRAMPDTDGKSCERLYQVISGIDNPKQSMVVQVEAQ